MPLTLALRPIQWRCFIFLVLVVVRYSDLSEIREVRLRLHRFMPVILLFAGLPVSAFTCLMFFFLVWPAVLTNTSVFFHLPVYYQQPLLRNLNLLFMIICGI
jgi:hypothetical protein